LARFDGKGRVLFWGVEMASARRVHRAIEQTAIRGASQLAVLVVVVFLLGSGYWALDRFSDSQRDMLMVESRGMLLIQGLSKFRLERGSYPEMLDQLVPQQIALLPRCPDGTAFMYKRNLDDYSLRCENVVFGQKPYVYQSGSRAWIE
jgi:hypothetical protein